jgi:hypothetical protein
MEPDSNQQSKTSGTRRSVPFPFWLGISRWSMKCLWRSVTFSPAHTLLQLSVRLFLYLHALIRQLYTDRNSQNS